MLDAGLWPRTDEEVGRQGLLGFVPAERVRLFAPHDNIHFYKDSPILLDYRQDRSNPAVIRLHWRLPPEPNVWVRCADTFDGFADMLGLEQGARPRASC